MRIVHHANARALLEHAGAFLELREAENVPILGTCLAHVARAGDAEQLWVAFEDEASVVAAAACTPPFDLALSVGMSEHAVDALVDDLLARDRTVPGVFAEVGLASRLAARWTEGGLRRAEQTMRQGVYALTRVLPLASPPSGALRVATAGDIPTIAAWMGAFAEEALLPMHHRDAFTRRAATVVGRGEQFVWEDRGRSVAMASLQGWTKHGVRIAAVYTPPDARGHGYASACVAALSAHALATGRRFCVLYTDMANPTSNRIYMNVGYELLYESLRFAFGTAA